MRSMKGPGRVSHARVCSGSGNDGPGGTPSWSAAGGGATAVRSSTAIRIRDGIRIPLGMSRLAVVRGIGNREHGAGVLEKAVDQSVEIARDGALLACEVARLADVGLEVVGLAGRVRFGREPADQLPPSAPDARRGAQGRLVVGLEVEDALS